eukprot:GHVO01017295.1.p1 GENE.GHVO01017295.1~~GHVO01017295.1.p1  ORF type:complete len:355 (+),score=59.10 GHVO01017295.1:41-1105(+)
MDASADNAHDGPIWSACWCSAAICTVNVLQGGNALCCGQVEGGRVGSPSLLATASDDRTLGIWRYTYHGVDGSTHSSIMSTARLRDAKGPINAVQFAPWNSGGTRLAAASSDGTVRVYEAQDVPEFRIWTLDCQFATAFPLPSPSRCDFRGFTSLCWSLIEPSAVSQEQYIAATAAEGALEIFSSRPGEPWKNQTRSKGHRRSSTAVAWCPNFSRLYDTLVTCGQEPPVCVWQFWRDNTTEKGDASWIGSSTPGSTTKSDPSHKVSDNDCPLHLRLTQTLYFDDIPREICAWRVAFDMIGNRFAVATARHVFVFSAEVSTTSNCRSVASLMDEMLTPVEWGCTATINAQAVVSR